MSSTDAFAHSRQESKVRVLHHVAATGLLDKADPCPQPAPPDIGCLLQCKMTPGACRKRQEYWGLGDVHLDPCKPCPHYLFPDKKPPHMRPSYSPFVRMAPANISASSGTVMGMLRIERRHSLKELGVHLHLTPARLKEIEAHAIPIRCVRDVERQKLEEFFGLTLEELLAKPAKEGM